MAGYFGYVCGAGESCSLQDNDNCRYKKPGSGLFPRFPYHFSAGRAQDCHGPGISYIAPGVSAKSVSGVVA